MAKRVKSLVAAARDSSPTVAGTELIARVLALIFMRDMETDGEKARALSAAGFSNNTIAAMLHIGANQVRARLAEKPAKRRRPRSS